ncbi:ATP-binding protein [Streptomyces sp. NPDC020983]|uniref:ATP-binding protein n=1 Tax=Streptomyces sp. NPDC020983 TaxID=3365106 RepID=UPI0037A73B21
MTDTYDPYDDNAHREEARTLARKEAIYRRLQILAVRRPPAFDTPGELHPSVNAWVDQYLAGARGSLALIGEIGTGKTWTLWKIAETLVRANWRGRLEIAAAYEVKAATDRPGNRELVDLWKRADLFAIDDLGVQRVNDWDAEHLHALIDTRWQHRRPTILASNVKDLAAVVGPRAASRLADGATLIKFTGSDRRRAA